MSRREIGALNNINGLNLEGHCFRLAHLYVGVKTGEPVGDVIPALLRSGREDYRKRLNIERSHI